jgi:hypothetical protein
MWKLALKTDWYKMFEDQHLETWVKFFLQIFETLPRSLKDENKIEKKNWIGSFKTF